jgi:hypothetical protein
MPIWTLDSGVGGLLAPKRSAGALYKLRRNQQFFLSPGEKDYTTVFEINLDGMKIVIDGENQI